MRQFLLILPLFLAAGCETTPRPYAPVDNVRYSAIGENPFWLLTIGDDRIVLRQSPRRRRRRGGLAAHPAAHRRRQADLGVRRRHQVITIETAPAPAPIRAAAAMRTMSGSA